MKLGSLTFFSQQKGFYTPSEAEASNKIRALRMAVLDTKVGFWYVAADSIPPREANSIRNALFFIKKEGEDFVFFPPKKWKEDGNHILLSAFLAAKEVLEKKAEEEASWWRENGGKLPFRVSAGAYSSSCSPSVSLEIGGKEVEWPLLPQGLKVEIGGLGSFCCVKIDATEWEIEQKIPSPDWESWWDEVFYIKNRNTGQEGEVINWSIDSQ